MKNYYTHILLIFFLPWQDLAAQKRHISPELLSKLRTNSYERCIEIGDSLTLEYDSSPFLVGHPDEPKLDGLTVIREFYVKASLLTSNSDEAKARITDLSIRIKVDTFLQLEEQYAKIIRQADTLYAAKKYDKSMELYERAFVLKPSDVSVQNRIEEIKTLYK